MSSLLRPALHYVGIAVLLLLGYFLVSDLLAKHPVQHLTGPDVVSVQPTPPNRASQALEKLADALKEKALSDALSGRISDLSAAQSTVAGVISQGTGLNSRMAAALAAGLTQPAPQRQVIEVRTQATSKVTPPPVELTDDIIKRDLKEVLADTTIKTDVHTAVDVKWEDKPLSPIFAAYGASGASGAGYTLHRSSAFDVDLLGLKTARSIEIGAGLEHRFKGTSAGLGIGVFEDLGVHRTRAELFAAVHF